MRLQPTVAACLFAVMALLLAGYRLSRAGDLSADEAAFASQTQTVSARSIPLFFHAGEGRWLQPLAVYGAAAVRTAGGGANSGRIVSAIAGAANVALVFVIATFITERMWIGAIAATILLLTPAHDALSIRGTDALLPSTLVLLWMYATLRFFMFDLTRTLVLAAAMLGLCIYAHPTGPLTAIFLWTLTVAVARRRNRLRLFTSTAMLCAMWLPAAAWFARHFETYADTFGRWFVFAAHLRNPIDGLQAFVNPNTLGTRASLYWGFWDPSWLFFATDTGSAPLLLITAPLIVVAVLRWPSSRTRDAAMTVIVGVLLVPLAGATFGVAHYMADAAAVLPILAILAAIGVDELVGLVVPRRALDDDVAVVTIE